MARHILEGRDGNVSRRQAIASLAAAGSYLLPRFTKAAAATQSLVQVMPDLHDDGSGDVAPGEPQMARLLDGYRTRPAWKVAGVDYAVGVSPEKRLLDWRRLDLPNVQVGTNVVVVSGDDAVLDGIDFSTGGGAQLYIKSQDRAQIRDCRFGGEYLKTIVTGIVDSSSLRMVVQSCSFDGAGAGNAACVLFCRRAVDVTVQYCHVYNFPCRVMELVAGGLLDYRFNLIGEGALQAGAHMNYLEFGAGEAQPLVAFNTTAQTVLARSGGEGFQFYFNGGGVMHQPLCMHNTMIARGGGGRAVMSYLVHGSRFQPGITTVVAGKALMRGNFLDASSAYGAFYGGSFAGWEIDGNTDMVTRQTLRPI